MFIIVIRMLGACTRIMKRHGKATEIHCTTHMNWNNVCSQSYVPLLVQAMTESTLSRLAQQGIQTETTRISAVGE